MDATTPFLQRPFAAATLAIALAGLAFGLSALATAAGGVHLL